ncbi:MAG: DPP IV N-terminal domain-containing protein [bacterium]
MRRSSSSIVFFVVLICLNCWTTTGVAQQPLKLSLETMSDPTIFQAFSTPRTWWLDDNTAVIYDTRKPAAEQTLERFDPATGKRTPMLDRAKAAASLSKLFPDGQAPRMNPVPTLMTTDGKKGLYLLRGDIFILDIPSAEFYRITNTSQDEKSATFSPDGNKIAFVRENDLYVYDIVQKKEARLTNDGSKTLLNGTLSWVYWEEIFGRRDIGYWWSEDSKAVAYLQTDESGVSVQHYVDITPWTPTVTTQRYPKAGEKNPAVRLGVIEISSEKTTWADIDRNSYEYIIRVNWLPDNKQVCVRTQNRLQTESDLYFIDRASGKSKFILKDTDEGWVNMTDDLYFLKDGKHFLLSSERDGYEHLYRFTMEGKLVNLVTPGEWSMRSSGGGAFWIRQAVAGIDEKEGWVYFTGLGKSSIERHLYRVKFDGTQLEVLTEQEGTHAIALSKNCKYYFDRYSNITAPPSLTLYEVKKGKKSVLAESNYAGLKKYDVQYVELFQIPARDGYLLPASIRKPKDFDPNKKYPVIVYVYGGPSAPQVSNAFGNDVVWENVLLNQGYICMKVDNRAATGRSKKLENLILYRSPGEIELNDLVDGVRWMKKQPGIDPERFGIYGWSGGGTNTILAMTRSKEFKAGMAGGSVTDYRFYDSKWAEAVMKTEKENLKGYEENSLLKYAEDLHGKLMLIHGSHDDNVHIQNIWRFIDELIKANKLFELMVYPMRGHGVGDPVGRAHWNNVQIDFWKRNL